MAASPLIRLAIVCMNCRHWEESGRYDGDSKVGWCHRYPQKIEKKYGDYCGEYVQKQQRK